MNGSRLQRPPFGLRCPCIVVLLEVNEGNKLASTGEQLRVGQIRRRELSVRHPNRPIG